MAPRVTWRAGGGLRQLPEGGPAPRRGARAGRGRERTARDSAEGLRALPGFLSDPGVRGILVPVERREFAPQRGRARHAAAPVIEVSVEAEGTESYLLVVRHASGALSFHAPETPEVATPAAVRGAAAARRKRSARAAGRQRMATFKVPLSTPRAPDVRRGVVSDAVEAIVDAILVRIGAVVAETVVDLAEAAIWKLTGRERGLFA